MEQLLTLGAAICVACVIYYVYKILIKGGVMPRKSRTNRKLCGVCGGLGEAMNIDPVLVRLIWVIFTLCGGSGILIYIVCALLMRNE